MADYRDGLRLLWLPGLITEGRKPINGVQYWLDNGTYAVSPSRVKGAIALENINASEYSLCLAADINRLASAGRETLLNIRPSLNLPRSSAWPLVMVYYSALFHAHVLLRMWGISVSYLHTNELFRLKRMAAAYGVVQAGKFKRGQYVFLTDRTQSRVELLSEQGGDGTHGALWKKLSEALDEVGKALITHSLLATADKKDVSRQLEFLKSAVSRAGTNPAWLSMKRNEIQYRQEHGVWFPYACALTVEKLTARLSAALAHNIPLENFDCSSGDEVTAFFESCLALIVAVRGSLADMAESNVKASFLRFGSERVETTLAG